MSMLWKTFCRTGRGELTQVFGFHRNFCLICRKSPPLTRYKARISAPYSGLDAKNPSILRKTWKMRNRGGNKAMRLCSSPYCHYWFARWQNYSEIKGLRQANIFSGGFLRCMRSRSTTPAAAGAKGAGGSVIGGCPPCPLIYFPTGILQSNDLLYVLHRETLRWDSNPSMSVRVLTIQNSN